MPTRIGEKCCHPTVALRYVWSDGTSGQGALHYSSLSFHGTFPDSESHWNVQTQRNFDWQNRTQSGTVHLPKGVPVTLMGSLIDSVSRDGSLTISQEKRDWILEYRFGNDGDWQPCEEAKQEHVSSYGHFSALLEALSGNEPVLEIRVR